MTTPEPPAERRSPLKKIIVIAVGIAVVVAVLVVGSRLLAGLVGGNAALDVEPGIPVSVEIPAGSSARVIATAMEEAGVVRAKDLQSLINDQGVASQLQAGIYHLETLMTPEAVLERLLTGPDTGTGMSVSVYEGDTIRRVIERLSEQTGYPVADFEDALTSGAVTSSLMPDSFPPEVDALTRWEGLLFPARYEVPEGATPVEMLTMMSREMEKRVDAVDWSRLGELGVNRYEALIVASLIQKEAGVDEDRPMIASVIYNRLERGMPLQLDVTVIYALGENPGRVLGEHLKVDSPWNTYLIPGLPPTPIGTMQMASIEAAADPATSDYLFFVVVSEDGKAGFSKTYEEHKEKIAKAKAEGILP